MTIKNLQIVNDKSLDDTLSNQMVVDKETSKVLTGYATIDRPWEKYYNQEELSKSRPKRTVYQEVLANNFNYGNDLAIEFFGSKIKYKKLFESIDAAAKSFEEYGIKKGDIVTISCAGIPEMVYSFYALSKLGAVANFMSPYFDKDGMVDRINDCESTTLMVMDKFYPEIKDSIAKTGINKIIVTPTLNSSILRFLPQEKIKLNYKNELFWNQFIKDGRRRGETLTVGYEFKMPLAMVYSSGTTGASKAILLSNDSFQNSIQAYPASGVDISRGQKFYQIIPPWFSTGLSTCIHLPLSYGTSVYMDPRFERAVFIKNIFKAKPNYTVAPTSMYEGFLDEKLVGRKSLEFFNYPFEGGEPLKKEVLDKIETVFKQHGNTSRLRTAYGQCECGAAITTQTQKDDQPAESVGIPLPGVTVGIFDENRNELCYGERGEILVDTPCGMTEYYKNQEATNKYFYVDGNGIRWSQTGDIGYMDSNGNLFIEGRMSDFSVVNGEHIYNFDIEKIIEQQKDVKTCDVICNNDGNVVAHIIFEDGIEYTSHKLEQRLQEIQKDIYEYYQNQNMVPQLFKIRKSFPYAKSGKRDVNLMKAEIDGLISVNNTYLADCKQKVKQIKK